MEFVIPTQELNYLVAKTSGIVSQRAPIPILSHLLLEAKEGELVVVATDLTVGMRCRTEAKVVQEGSITVPARNFSQLMRELTASNVSVSTTENGGVKILADSSDFMLQGMGTDHYPPLPDVSEATVIRLPKTTLRTMLYQTAFAVAKEHEQYAVTGILMRIGGGKLTLLATDGRKVARADAEVDTDSSLSTSFIIPIKAVDEIQKALQGNEEEEITLSLLEDRIAVESPGTQIVTQLLSGEFPDIDPVFPKDPPPILVTLHREELTTLMRQLSLFTEDIYDSCLFSFTKGELTMTINNSTIGNGKVSMPVDYSGDPLEISFHPSYFLEVLRHCKGEVVTLGLTDGYNPGVLTDNSTPPSVASGASPLYILMPMRSE